MSAPAPRRAAPRRRAPPPRATPALRVPFSPRALRRAGAWSALALIAAAGLAGLWAAGVPARLAADAVDASVRGGFEVRKVEIAGLRHLDAAPVRAAALAGPSSAMIETDLVAIRARLVALPWVADATVARRLPDTLGVTIVERVPAAIWQWRGRQALVDAQGRVLARDGLARFGRLPLVVGAGANTELASLAALMGAAPALASKIDSATWVGARRWDVKLKSGEVLALPEGYARAEAALAAFDRLNRERTLIGRGFARFDLRLDGKMVVRVSNEPGASVPAPGETRI